MTLHERLLAIRARPFFRALAVVVGGSAAAQIINLVCAPIATRLYGPTAFGVLGVFLALVYGLSPVATLAYEQATVLPKSDDEARILVRLSLVIAACFSAALLLVFGVARDQIAHLVGFGASPWYLLLVPAVVFFTASEATLIQWMMRIKLFKTISASGVAYAAILNGLRIGLGLFVPTGPALLLENAAGDVSYLSMLWSRVGASLRFDSSPRQRAESGVTTKHAARSYRDFPLFRAPEVLINSVSQNLPTIILAALFGPAAAGFYALAVRVLQLPGTLISSSLGTVFLPRAARAGHEGEPLRPLLLRATGGLALAGILPFGLVVVLGPWLFGFVFGNQWVLAGQYARWIALWQYLSFLNTPCVQAIPILGVQKEFLVFGVVTLPIRVGALLAGALVLSSGVAAIALFSLSMVAANVVLITWVLWKSGIRLRKGMPRGGEVS